MKPLEVIKRLESEVGVTGCQISITQIPNELTEEVSLRIEFYLLTSNRNRLNVDVYGIEDYCGLEKFIMDKYEKSTKKYDYIEIQRELLFNKGIIDLKNRHIHKIVSKCPEYKEILNSGYSLFVNDVKLNDLKNNDTFVFYI